MEAFYIAAFGASLQELLHWYELREKLSAQKYKRLLRSKGYWILVGLMIVASGIAIAIYAQKKDKEPIDLMLLGAAVPVLFKKGVSAAQSRKVVLGEEDEGTLRVYLS